jgi:hypothetical protein
MADMRDKYWFEEWLHEISDFENNNIAYYDKIAKNIWISVYNEQIITKTAVNSRISFPSFEDRSRSSNPTIKELPLDERLTDIGAIYTARLTQAIPTRIETIQVAWADTDQLMKYSVNFSYESLTIESYANRTGKAFQHLDKVQK